MSGIHRRRPAPIEMERSGQTAVPPQPRRCRGNREIHALPRHPETAPPSYRGAVRYLARPADTAARLPTAPQEFRLLPQTVRGRNPHDTTANAAQPARDVKHLPGRRSSRQPARLHNVEVTCEVVGAAHVRGHEFPPSKGALALRQEPVAHRPGCHQRSGSASLDSPVDQRRRRPTARQSLGSLLAARPRGSQDFWARSRLTDRLRWCRRARRDRR
jgi:hypothetical protein